MRMPNGLCAVGRRCDGLGFLSRLALTGQQAKFRHICCADAAVWLLWLTQLMTNPTLSTTVQYRNIERPTILAIRGYYSPTLYFRYVVIPHQSDIIPILQHKPLYFTAHSMIAEAEITLIARRLCYSILVNCIAILLLSLIRHGTSFRAHPNRWHLPYRIGSTTRRRAPSPTNRVSANTARQLCNPIRR